MAGTVFTSNNIVAILRSVPESSGTYEDVARVARENYEVSVTPHTISNWVSAGQKLTRDNKKDAGYAMFAVKFKELVKLHCSDAEFRRREMEAALEILSSTCDCGNPLEKFEDNTKGAVCVDCKMLDRKGQ